MAARGEPAATPLRTTAEGHNLRRRGHRRDEAERQCGTKSSDLPLDQLVAFLLERSEELQTRLGTLENTVAEHPEQWRAEIEALRVDLTQAMGAELERARETHIRVRLAGIASLCIGSSLLSIASL